MLTPEQAKNRVGKIGSSDVPRILGISPYGDKSPAKQARDAYFSIMGQSPRTETDSMRAGNFLEPAILNWAEWKIGKPFARDTQVVRDWQIASFDGLGDDFVVEAKWVQNPDMCAHWGRAGCKKPENVPEYVLAQVQHQLMLTGFSVAYVAALRAINGFGLYAVPRDDELIGLIFEAEQKFYTDHILPKVAPQGDDEQQAA